MLSNLAHNTGKSQPVQESLATPAMNHFTETPLTRQNAHKGWLHMTFRFYRASQKYNSGFPLERGQAYERSAPALLFI